VFFVPNTLDYRAKKGKVHGKVVGRNGHREKVFVGQQHFLLGPVL
jgi:hypothetical protein